MKTTNDLFVLIKSLSKSEKRYFRLSILKKSNEQDHQNYLKLFDTIERQSYYDEAEIISKFENQKFIKHISSEKNYLYQYILKTLHRYHSKSNNEVIMNNSLHYAEILFQKGLFDQSKKIIRKSKKIALENDLILQSVNISKFNISFSLQNEKKAKALERELSEAISNFKLALEKLQNQFEYYELYVDFLTLIRTEGEIFRTKRDLKKFKRIMNNQLIIDETRAISQEAKKIFFFINQTYSFLKGDFDTAYLHYKKFLEDDYIDRAGRIEDIEKVRLLSNFCEICIRLNKTNEALSILEDIQKFSLKSVLNKGKQFYRYYDNLFVIYNKQAQFEKVIKLTKEIDSGIELYKDTIHKSKLISIYYQIAYSYFGIGDYKQSIKWLNLILNDSSSNLRKDIICFSRILFLIVNYENNNLLFIEYLIKSNEYYFSSRNKLYDFEKKIFTFFKKITTVSDEKKIILLFTELLNILQKKSRQSIEINIYAYLDIESWIESKIQKKQFIEVVKSKKITH
ncbi:MAG: hypothetical protein QM535_03560 [Limnohabitans sp.]|nr:hypothetical protein [Limnohabitans sp.]